MTPLATNPIPSTRPRCWHMTNHESILNFHPVFPILLTLDAFPGLVGIEMSHLPRERAGHRAKIFLIHNAVLIHDERLHSRYPVLFREGNERESADHFPFDNVIRTAAWRIGALRLENAEVITVIRDRFGACSKSGGSIGKGLRNQGVGLTLPIQTNFLSRRTADGLQDAIVTAEDSDDPAIIAALVEQYDKEATEWKEKILKQLKNA